MALRVGIVAEPAPLAERLTDLIGRNDEILAVALVDGWHEDTAERISAAAADALLVALPDHEDGGLEACRALSAASGDAASWTVLWATRPLDESVLSAAGVDRVLGEATTPAEIRDALLASLL